jgi:hypothetical protein
LFLADIYAMMIWQEAFIDHRNLLTDSRKLKTLKVSDPSYAPLV